MLFSSCRWLAALLLPVQAAVLGHDAAAPSAFVLTASLFPGQPAVQLDDGRVLFNRTGRPAIFHNDARLGVIYSAGLPCSATSTSLTPFSIVQSSSGLATRLSSTIAQQYAAD